MYIFITVLALVFIVLNVPHLRRKLITGHLFKLARQNPPKISVIEEQAIEAGTSGFDTEFFSGHPDWEKFRSIGGVQLSQEEQAFLDGPTEKFCELIDDWRIRGIDHAVGDNVWDFAKKHGFLGLRVSKEAGGHGFSAQAQSIILGKVASRSLDASTTVEVPNSLGPDELLEEYGTLEQKEQYLKALVSGDEIACFAITSPMAGSDAASMRDVGHLTYGIYDGEEALGINLTWFKRYITLAPKATVIVLAFHLFDPEKHLSEEEDCGITLALIPANHPGVNIGRRHLPGGSVFPNGPVWGEDVFIPLKWVLGGKPGIGKGWKMVMQCLAAGRGISLPSMSCTATKMMLLTSTAYARVRRQFNKPIAKIEGIEEPLARLVEAAYVSEAIRSTTAAMVTKENRPLVITSLVKYRATEIARQAINDAMDIHAGKGIIDGPSNYLQSTYQISPVAITVEGANIITRSLIAVGQATLRSHPYFKKEIDALRSTDTSAKPLIEFDRAFTAHIVHLAVNCVMSVFHNVTRGVFAHPGNTPKELRHWYRTLSHASRRFAFLADIVLITYQGHLKKRQKIGGRLSDALSELYLLSCTLKQFEDDGCLVEDLPIVRLSMENGLYRFEVALSNLIRNVEYVPTRWILRFVVGIWAQRKNPAQDSVAKAAVENVLHPSPTRDRLTRYTYIPKNSQEPIGALEKAFELSVAAEDILHKADQAIRRGAVQRFLDCDWIDELEQQGILTKTEVKKLREVTKLVEEVSAVDHFDRSKIQGIIHE